METQPARHEPSEERAIQNGRQADTGGTPCVCAFACEVQFRGRLGGDGDRERKGVRVIGAVSRLARWRTAYAFQARVFWYRTEKSDCER